MKQSKSKKVTKRVKPARKNNKKIHKFFKSLSKKRTKTMRKFVKLARKNNKKIHKFFKSPSKKRSKNTRKPVKPMRKTNKKNAKRQINDRRKVVTTGLLILLSVTAGTSFGLVYADQISNNKTSAVVKLVKQISEAPNSTTAVGPAQDNPLFSSYPSWAQDFATDTSGKLNANYWEINEGPAQNSNNEAEYYTDNYTNLRIQNGSLILEATQQPEPQGYNYASARIDTDSHVSFLYGRMDITAQLPSGVGTWPAAWLLPANNTYEDLSPTSDSIRYLNGGEIDLIEAVGFQPDTEYGIVHTLSDLNNPNGVGSYNTVTVPNDSSTYNEYSLLWTPTSITFEVNDVPFYTYNRPASANYTTWPFDQPFYLILNLAIGGSWGGEDTSVFPTGIDNSSLPATMNIKSIYYYPYVGSLSTNN